MNIFLTHPSPVVSAIALDDKRVIKMAVESAQVVCTSIRFCYPLADDHLYRVSHYNHPCAIWCRQSLRNFLWLYDHGKALCKEYTLRYDKRHRSEDVLDLAFNHLSVYGDLFPEPSPPGVDTTFEFNSSGFATGDVFDDYKLCMVNKWLNNDVRQPVWTGRERPAWFEEYADMVIHHQSPWSGLGDRSYRAPPTEDDLAFEARLLEEKEEYPD